MSTHQRKCFHFCLEQIQGISVLPITTDDLQAPSILAQALVVFQRDTVISYGVY